MPIIEEALPRNQAIRIGTRNTRSLGPLGTAKWEQETLQRRRGSIGLHYQEVTVALIENAKIRVHGNVEIPCHRATREQLRILEATLLLVPPNHLQLVNARKPQGFLMSNTAGRGASLSYMGGLNPSADYRSTPTYDERRLILITYGALWQYRYLGICPTVLHEIGHVMTHNGEISYHPFSEERAQQLAGTSVSRNPGRLEALCNAYMFFLCYASTTAAIQGFGSQPATIQKDRVTREALRQCRAFQFPLLDAQWQRRFAER